MTLMGVGDLSTEVSEVATLMGVGDLSTEVSEVATLKQTNWKSCNIIKFHCNTNAYLGRSCILHVTYNVKCIYY